MNSRQRINNLNTIKYKLLNLNNQINNYINLLESKVFNTCNHEFISDSSELFHSTKICKFCGLSQNRHLYNNNPNSNQMLELNINNIRNLEYIINTLNNESVIIKKEL